MEAHIWLKCLVLSTRLHDVIIQRLQHK
jgi:hypothetical protein